MSSCSASSSAATSSGELGGLRRWVGIPGASPAFPSAPSSVCPITREPLAVRICPEERGRPPAVLGPGAIVVPTVPRGRSRAGNAGRGSCFSGDHAAGTHCVGQGRSRAERQRMCLYVTLPVQGGLFLNPKSRQQLAFLQGPGGSVLPCGLPWLRQCPVRLSAVFWDCGSMSWCLGWRRSSAASRPFLPMSCRVSLPGGFPQCPCPGQGHNGAGSCRRASTGNTALPAPRTTS